jgi:cytochrome P450
VALPVDSSTIPDHVSPALIVDYDIYADPRIAVDPHAGLLKLRAEAPGVFYTPANGGHWVALDPAAITRIMRTPKIFSNRQTSIPKSEHAPRMIPESLDPPEHSLYRKLMQSYFELPQIRHLELRIREWTDKHIAQVKADGQCEFVAAVAAPVPVSVLMELVGFPLERYEDFRALVNGIFGATDAAVRQGFAVKIMQELGALIATKRQAPANDILSRLIAADFEGRKLDDPELMSIGFLLFLAGLDTVTNAMLYGIRHLGGDPGLQAQLRSHPEMIPAAVDELLRRYTFTAVPRIVMEDTEVGVAKLRAGDMVYCLLPMVGLDEGLNPDALKVDIERAKRTHYAFGFGVHACLGQHLARLELKILYEHWLPQIGPFSVDTAKPVGRTRGGSVISMPQLWLRWGTGG